MIKTMRGSKWDCELNTDVCDAYTNADITIKLRMGFKQINPAGGAAEGTYIDYGAAVESADEKKRKIIKWDAASWADWKKKFVASAQAYWHGKFWLVNNFDDLTYDVKGKKFRPNLYCRFELKDQPLLSPDEYGPNDVHFTIEVVRLHPTVTWFGSHSTLYDSRDTNLVEKNTDSKGKPVMQRAHVHEVGHLLGMGHVDEGKAHCPKSGDTNKKVCYGITDIDMKNVMGSGMTLETRNAVPWREAAVLLTGKGAVSTMTDWAAKMGRRYPRTHEEAVAGKEFKSKPSRG